LAQLFGLLVGWLVGWSRHGKLDVVNLNSITLANFCCHQVVSKYKKSEEHIVFLFLVSLFFLLFVLT